MTIILLTVRYLFKVVVFIMLYFTQAETDNTNY